MKKSSKIRGTLSCRKYWRSICHKRATWSLYFVKGDELTYCYHWSQGNILCSVQRALSISQALS